jgi:hypothetical protein
MITKELMKIEEQGRGLLNAVFIQSEMNFKILNSVALFLIRTQTI